MPKEQINYPVWQKVTVDASGDGDESVLKDLAVIDSSLHVHWEAGGNVVLGIKSYSQTSWEDFESANPWPVFNGVEVLTPFLSRGEINQLIIVLRRARDQAYGRDQ